MRVLEDIWHQWLISRSFAVISFGFWYLLARRIQAVVDCVLHAVLSCQSALILPAADVPVRSSVRRAAGPARGAGRAAVGVRADGGRMDRCAEQCFCVQLWQAQMDNRDHSSTNGQSQSPDRFREAAPRRLLRHGISAASRLVRTKILVYVVQVARVPQRRSCQTASTACSRRRGSRC